MLIRTRLILACGLLASMAGAAFAQNDGIKFFHLDFVVREVDNGKVINARHYWTTMGTGDRGCSIRTGSKIPVPIGPGSTSYSYADVGVNIDCNTPLEVDGNLTMNLVAEVSSVASSQNPPVIRQNKWNSKVIVPLNKNTLVFSSDDLASKGQIQVELTATAVK